MSDPIRELSVRDPLPEGVALAPAVRIIQGPFDPAPSHLVIFIHGFNDTAAFAENAYGVFLEHSGIAGCPLAGSPCFFHWPSNRNWGIASAAAYVVDPAVAKQSAGLLYDFLVSPRVTGPKPLQLTLISHSLGGRVALELLARAAADPDPLKPRIEALCLLAPAVRVDVLGAGGALLPAACLPTRTAALFSGHDDVLFAAFPLGQTVAGDGFFPVAVGHAGSPPGLWTARSDMGQYGYGHSDYWPGVESATAVAAFLGLPVSPPPATRTLPSRPAAARRALPSPAALGSRTISSGQVA